MQDEGSSGRGEEAACPYDVFNCILCSERVDPGEHARLAFASYDPPRGFCRACNRLLCHACFRCCSTTTRCTDYFFNTSGEWEAKSYAL